MIPDHKDTSPRPKALVLGGYGLIGSATMRALSQAGFHTIGLGRSRTAALASDAQAEWIIRDIPAISVSDWKTILADVEVVVNAAGALQDGGRDDLKAIHVTVINTLLAALEGTKIRLIQISAAGAHPEASTRFFRTKAQGDALIAARYHNWVILRPTLVLAPEAYGGTALLRAAAALPGVTLRLFPETQIQTVHIDDLTQAICMAARSEVPAGTLADLTEEESRSFPELLQAMRSWLGYPPARWSLPLDQRILKPIGAVADLLGHLGWRAPLRSTALSALQDGIAGDPQNWTAAGGSPCRSLTATLRSIPATRQDRIFARAYLALPLAIAVLALFWTLSGLIALADLAGAMAVLTDRALPHGLAAPIVLGGAATDICLGLGILWRRWSRPTALSMISLSALYLMGSALVAPDLWGDPLGPMVKVLPGMVLAVMVWLLMEER